MANLRAKAVIPALSAQLLSSLSPDQRKQLIILLGKYRKHYADYFLFRWGMVRTSGFVYEMWATQLFNEIIKPSGLNKSMWRVLLIIWSMEQSKRYKAIQINRKTLQDLINQFYCTPRRMDIARLSRYLMRYNWIGHTKQFRKPHTYYLTEKAHTLIRDYSVRYGQLFNQFFEPLEFTP